MMKEEQLLRELFAAVDIEVNGPKAWDIQVHNPKFYKRVLESGSLGLGESYMEGWWDSYRLDEFFEHILSREFTEKLQSSWFSILQSSLPNILFNLQSASKAFQIGKFHYDLGNDLYQNMLDKRMIYTSAFWDGAVNLDQAQVNKLEMVCQKIQLEPGETILDIGCGWGGFAKYAAEKYKAKVVGITVSEEQAKLANKHCEGLSVDIRLQDYRTLNGKFDKIVSLGMFEHVGYKNHDIYFKKVKKLLKKDGLFLLQTIGRNHSGLYVDPWFQKYIFPGGNIPSIKQIAETSEKQFVMEDWHNFGTHYDQTLMAWYQNFNLNWPKLANKYDEKFYRLWKYYLLASAAAFRARKLQVWQIVFSAGERIESCKSLRQGFASVKEVIDSQKYANYL